MPQPTETETETPKGQYLKLEVWLTGDTLAPEAQFDRLNRLGAVVVEEAIRRNLTVEYVVSEDI